MKLDILFTVKFLSTQAILQTNFFCFNTKSILIGGVELEKKEGEMRP